MLVSTFLLTIAMSTFTWDSCQTKTRNAMRDYFYNYDNRKDWGDRDNQGGSENGREKSIIDVPKKIEPQKTTTEDSTLIQGPIITICCEPGLYYRGSICYGNESLRAEEMIFPTIYDESLNVSSMRAEEFIPRYGVPCRYGSFALRPEPPQYDIVYLMENGTILVPSDFEYSVLYPGDYCLASVLTASGTTEHRVAVCFQNPDEDERITPIIYPILLIFSTPFLAATFIVYTILPELKSMHGMTLRAYVSCLFVAYVGLASVQLGDQKIIDNQHLCTSMAFIIHFSFLSSFFWLNVMCFDIWWTFGGFRSMQGSVKQRERKKFIIYSIYAWGSATLLTGVCFIMDFVPSVPRSFIKPEFGVRSCWFSSEAARAIYFYGPIGVTVICNICLFVSTTIKIIQHKKDTAHHLKGMDSRRHDDNKQWFNLYLKLFIVMGINWSMEIISWLFNETPQYVWYITDLANTLQGVIIFIIFVWKDKTKRLLLKRLGCQNRSFQSRNSTRSAYHSSASRTCTTTMAVTAPLHEKSNPFAERTKITTDESDCI